MGGVQSRAQTIKRFNKINPEKWDIVRKEGLTQIAVDSKGREGQVNVIKLDPTKKPEEELQVYYYRRTFDGPLVKAYGAESVQSKSMGVCGVDNAMKVITERIVKRWGELPQLTFPQILYSLSQALQGYQALHKQVGAFQVNHNMMGLNNQGDLHVWLNENFAQNNPSLEKGILYITGTDKIDGVSTQTEMINNILKLVEDKCEQGKYPKDFSEQIYSRNTNFNDTIDTVDNYIQKRNILIPNKIHLDNTKMYVTKIKKMEVVSGSRAFRQSEANANRVSFSPIKSNLKKYDYSISNSPKVSNPVPVLNTTYQITSNRIQQKNQIMTPKHVTFGTPKQGKFSSGNLSSPAVSGGYYTGGQGATFPASNLQYQRYTTDLRLNPNIDVTQSVYEAKQKTPQSFIRSNETSEIKPTTVNPVPLSNESSFDRNVDHHKIQVIGNRPAFNPSPITIYSNQNNVATKKQTLSSIITPIQTFSPDTNKKAAIKFNYVAPETQKIETKIDVLTSIVDQSKQSKGDNNKIVLETSQVTKQY